MQDSPNRPSLQNFEDAQRLRYLRILIGIAPLVYLVWWFVVRATLPEAYNPILSRLVILTLTFGGLGSGLTVAKQLANELGGDVKLVSSQEGAGTEFQLLIQLR